MTAPRELMISIHVPKTGGGSFRSVLEAYADGHYQRDQGDLPLAPRSPRQRLRLAMARPQVKPDTRVVHGHFIATKYWRRYPDATYVCWFRDPVERLASQYYYWQRSPDLDHPTCRQLLDEQLSLEAFAALPEMRDVHRTLLGEVPLERLAFVGITERYDESLERFRRRFAPELQLRTTRRHVNTERSGERYDIDDTTRDRIAALNEGDMELYRSALARFEAAASPTALAAP